MDRINLIPESRQLARRRRVRCRVWVVSAVGYTALVVAACIVFRGLSTNKDTTTLGEELAGIDAELAQIEQEQSQLKPELADQRLILASGRSITDQPDWSLLLSYLADEVLGDSVTLSGCTLAPVAGSDETDSSEQVSVILTLNGHAKTTPAVSQFVLRLEELGLFDRVSLARTNREPFLDGQAIAFEAQCLMSSAGGRRHE